MATIHQFEDLEVWQMARKFAASIFQLTLNQKFLKEYRFNDQIKGSSGSVMDNIPEGFGRESRLEFINFLGIAKGSLSETKSQLYRAFDQNLIELTVFNCHLEEANIISAKIGAFMIYLNKSLVKGQKFKGRAN
ncbi:MAG: four helix bundle protein [Ferruginibacter sp.]|nr:four helix bundle protein [Ferruginibacter sp.]